MQRYFRTVKVSERLPDFGKRILFLNANYKGEFMSEYIPNEQIPLKKGKFIELKDSSTAIGFIKGNFTHWLEEITIEEIKS